VESGSVGISGKSVAEEDYIVLSHSFSVDFVLYTDSRKDFPLSI
jgi:hypothetical protein